jgi:hypothetical protein
VTPRCLVHVRRAAIDVALRIAGVDSLQLQADRHGLHVRDYDRPDGRVDAPPRPRLAVPRDGASIVAPALAVIAVYRAGTTEKHGQPDGSRASRDVRVHACRDAARTSEYTGHAHHGHAAQHEVAAA